VPDRVKPFFDAGGLTRSDFL